MEEQSSYYAVIPAEVRYDKELTAIEKLLYAEITALCRKEGYCYSTNKYFAELFNKSEITMSKWIKKLENKNYISIEIEKFRYNDGTLKTIRKIYINRLKENDKNRLKDFGENRLKENDKNRLKENFKYNNIINEKYNNKNKDIYGEFGNVLLTSEEYQKLADKNLLQYIDKLSMYIESKGAKYKSHYATILNWARKEDKIKQEEQSGWHWELVDGQNKYVRG